MSSSLSPILGMVKPLAQKYINAENMTKVFDAITDKFPAEEGEKTVLLVTKKDDGSVVGSVATMDAGHLITGVYAQEPLADLITKLLNKQ